MFLSVASRITMSSPAYRATLLQSISGWQMLEASEALLVQFLPSVGGVDTPSDSEVFYR